jgi:ferritin-like metal-binding protein YciE
MKAPKSTRAQIQPAHDEFEIAVVAELRHLRSSEKILQRMYPRLRTMPQLRNRFLQQLAEMQLRAQRLDAVLNPISTLQFSLPAAPAMNSPAA